MYDRIPQAETTRQYFETALTRGRKAADRVKRLRGVMRAKARERDRLRAVRDSLVKSLLGVHDAYPSLDAMGEFTLQVFALDMDPGRVRKALGGLKGTVKTLRDITQEQLVAIGRCKDAGCVKQCTKAYLGRVKSVLQRSEKHLKVLNRARKFFRALPTVDEDLFTVAIAGFPNVGKSTLLGKLTSADPEVQSYAFTTKGLNVGYFEHKYNRIQCIDTPGTLDREKMNVIERKAELALKYLADVIVYVYDPTESYPMADQRKLHERLEGFGKDVIVYVSKTDLADCDVDGLRDPDALKEELVRRFEEWI